MKLMNWFSFVVVFMAACVFAPADAYAARANAQHPVQFNADESRIPPPHCIPLRCPRCGEYFCFVTGTCACTRKKNMEIK